MMAVTRSLDSTSTGSKLRAVTPHVSDPLPGGPCRALYVGGSGSLVIVASGDEDAVTLTAVPAGTLPISVSHVRATSTATNIVAIY